MEILDEVLGFLRQQRIRGWAAICRFGLSCSVLLLVSVNGASGDDRINSTKYIPANTGPWVVTLSVNLEYHYGGSPAPPVPFSAADGFAFQPGDVLTIQYDSGLWCGGTYVSVQTCVDANGYKIYGSTDDNPLGTSTVYAPSKYMDRTTYPVYLMELVGTFADDRGQIVGIPFQVGNGPINVTIPSGATQLQLGANLYDYTTSRDFYTSLKATVSGPTPPTMKNVGSMAQLAVGGAWRTTIVLVNSGTTPAQVHLNFFDNSGNALPLSLTTSTGLLEGSTFDRTLDGGASLAIESGDLESQPTRVGWAQLLSDGSVGGFAIFTQRTGGQDQEAVVPLETRNSGSYVLWFDSTSGFVVGVALANTSPQAVTVHTTTRDESGLVIGTGTIPLAAQGHTSFVLPAIVAGTAQGRGTVEFHTETNGPLSMLGLRFRGVAFTTLPVSAK
jgi:hypothetical protein